jgi:hypothetical protein
MATQYSNKPIVLDGLVYALDFGNQKSYVSGSSSARSLNFVPYVSTLVTFSGAPIPTLTPNGIQFTNNFTVDTGNPFSVVSDSRAFTMMYTVRVAGNGLFTTKDNGNQSSLHSVLNTNLSVVGWRYYNANIFNQRQYSFTPSTINHHTWTYSSGSYTYYINGIPVTGSDSATGGGVSLTWNLYLSGRSAAPDQFWSGSLFNFYLYDRVLTADEIYSNYLITAQRIGLSTRPKPYTVDPDVYNFLTATNITDGIITSSLDTFVRGLKSASLWDKMIAIYPFVGTGSVGTNLTGSHRWNLKEATVLTSSFNGSWNGSTSGSTPSGSNTFISVPLSPTRPTLGSWTYPNYSSSNVHISILSYDTPVSRSYLMGTGMTEDLAASTLAGDYGTPAAAYSVRKVRTAYTGALMDVRRSYDNVTSSIGYLSNGDLDTGSLLDWTIPGRNTLPGAYSGLAAAYSLRRVSSSYSGSAIQANNGLVYRDIGFDTSGNLDTGSLTSLVATGSNVLAGNYSGLAAAYSLRRVTSSYSGFAIEVQSGSVSQSIGFDSFGNLDTASLLTFVGSGNGFIKTWYDQSGNNYHATQSVAASQPQIVSAGTIITQSNRPTIQFDGSSDNLLIPLQLTTGFDIFKTIRYTNVGGYPIILSEAPGVAGGFAFSRDPNNKFGISRKNQSTVTFTSTGSNNQVYVTNHYSTGVSAGNITVKFRLNGGSEETAAESGVISGSTSAIGMGNNFDYFAGTTHEILIYSSSQASNRTYITNNINAYYNIYTTSSTSTENAFVSTWYDQSGNNRHATQTATGSQPLIVSSGSLVTQSGRPAVRFDGISSSFSYNGAFLANTKYSIYHVSSRNSGKNHNWILGGSGNTTNQNLLVGYRFDNLYRYSQYSNDLDYTVSTYSTPILDLFSVHNTPTGKSIFYNNISVVTSSDTVDLASNAGSSIGYFPLLNEYYSGSISELVFFTGSNVSASRPLIENNINNYYNIYTGSNHGFVARWYDQSGNNRHATQTATGSQPMIVLSGSIINTNSRPSLKFDGVNDSLGINYNASAGTIAVQSVQKINSASGMSILIQESAPHLYFQWVNTPSTFANYYNGQYGETPFSTNQILHSFYMQTGGGGFFQNGISTITRTQGGSGASSVPMRIGAYAEGISHADSNHQEFIVYQIAQLSNKGPIEYNINNYYNIYPQTSSFATSSFTISAASGSVSASLNNRLTSGIASSGPLGLITVSRTGSNSLTIARNGVTSSFAVPASGALSTGIYLGAINNNGIALGNSPLGISFASVGTGLTNSDVQTLNRQIQLLKYNLQNPSIVTSGLVLNLDALIPSSYPGSGNTWFDLSSNNNNGTLTNGPVFTNDNGGAIVFDGTNDFISFQNLTTSNLGLNTSSGASLGCWLKLNLLSRYTGVFAFWSSGDQCDFGWDLTPANNIRLWKQSQTGLGITPYNNQWAYYVLTSSPTGVVFYINGVVSATWNNTNNVPFTSNRYLTFGDHWDSPIQGNSSQIQIYNRALTDAEVLQNFNATRGRFGV